MGDVPRRIGVGWREVCGLLLALLLAPMTESQSPASADAPGREGETTATQPAHLTPGGETLVAARARLASVHPKERTDRDIAVRAVLEFTLALGRGNAVRAMDLIDPVGYQPLPLAGELPEDPPKPIPVDTIRLWLANRKSTPLERLPAATFAVHSPRTLRESFPAIAAWMLPTDWAVVMQPADAEFDWVKRPACVVVRVRAGRPTIVGGNLFDALRSE